MKSRMKMLLPAAVIVLIALTPTLASAGQAKLRGYLVTHPSTLKGITGSCQCQWQWYTVGLRPGPVSLTLTESQDGPAEAPTYAVLVSLLRGGSSVGDGQVACDVSAKHCSNTMHIQTTINRPGVYYILVHGEGSTGIAYTLRLHGAVYRLRCGLYCR